MRASDRITSYFVKLLSSKTAQVVLIKQQSREITRVYLQRWLQLHHAALPSEQLLQIVSVKKNITEYVRNPLQAFIGIT